MESLRQHFGCGLIEITLDRVDFVVSGFSDINTKILPYFLKYPIRGAKSKDLFDFRQAASALRSRADAAPLGGGS